MGTQQAGTMAEPMTVDTAKNPYALMVWAAAVGGVAIIAAVGAFLARRKTPEALEKSIAKKVAKKVELERQMEEDKKELARIQAEIAPKQE